MENENPDPIQQQLIQARREQILDGATSVFAAKGFHRATVRDVAKAAGVADGTIYIYFENKTALLMGILNRINESPRREDDLARMGDMDVREFAEAYVRQRLMIIGEDNLNVFKAILPEVLVNEELRHVYMQQIIMPTFELAETIFSRLVEQGKIRDIHVPLTLRAFSGMVLGLLILRILEDPQLEAGWEQLPGLVTDLLLNGIAKE